MRHTHRGVAAVLAAAAVLALASAPHAAGAKDRQDDADARRACRGNLMRVGEAVYAALRSRPANADAREGWFVEYLMDARDRELQAHLQCPADPEAGVHHEDQPLRWALSYPVRNLETHPYDPKAGKPQVLAVCPHHDDGAFVITDDLDIRFLSRAELGVPEKGPIVVGEGATHPDLACVRFETKLNDERMREIQSTQSRVTCANHLRQLGGIYTSESMEKPGLPPFSGPALLVHYRQKHYIQRTREAVLMCPLDENVHPPENESDCEKYDALDLRGPLRKYVSFAVRDFVGYPINNRSESAEPVMACTHHPDGANVLFDDGAVVFMSRERLGLGPDDPITVGPKSKSPLLRPLTLGPEEPK